MKIITTKILLAGIVAVAFLTTGCEKDYICKCSKTYTSGSGSSTQNYSTYTYHDTKTTAISRCNGNETSGSDLGGNYSINCEIQ
ncbi:MAG TPA: hypothetical protein VNX01_02110 [Bacteroidia bacterium]|jgi:hypothetical protein|nr:hypothetical protein [Bacteroidia bacterium]